ncbi:hypothetical protein EDD22DRAFT_247988 [Suillus occidentalis]|nr:hypothetical protein EDD22DRAFT_247988 [Suillus occidentalis]
MHGLDLREIIVGYIPYLAGLTRNALKPSSQSRPLDKGLVIKQYSLVSFCAFLITSFLQHWPNTQYRIGHTIVPGIGPVSTPLPYYHIPIALDWVAIQPLADNILGLFVMERSKLGVGSAPHLESLSR